MTDTKPPSKSKSKKKKSKAGSQPPRNLTSPSEAKPLANEAKPLFSESKNAINEPSLVQLPKTINESTFINDVKVTLTENKAPLPEPSASSKKKKKHKKSTQKDAPAEKQPTPDPESEAKVLWNISREGAVELPFLPEITITKMSEEQKEPPKPSVEDNNDASEVSTSKKKKKKKKKKAQNAQEAEEKSPTSDQPNSEPTYVKVPATGDDFVLIVSHESFGNNVLPSANKNDAPSTLEKKSATASETMTLTMKTSENSPVSITPRVTISPVSSEQNGTSNKCPFQDATVKVNGENSTKDAPKKSKIKTPKDKSASENLSAATNKPEPSKSGKAQSINVDNKALKTKTASKEKQLSQVRLFAHLPQYRPHQSVLKHLESASEIHPAIVTVGAQYAEGIINGSNARCVALLAALKELICDYQTPPNKDLSRDLESKFQECVNFISKCRPLSVSMFNAVKVMKHYLSNIPSSTSDEDAKIILCKQIEKFINEEIRLAKEAISTFTTDKIVDGDVILTYAYSSVVKDSLCKAHEKKKFRVVVVDSRPKMEGKEMLKHLQQHGIDCTYTLINGVSYFMRGVTKVIIGAHALQANGYVMSRVGSSQIALVASFYNVPVLVCCETYKFCERVHTDSFVYNELGDPESFLKINNIPSSALENWKEMDKLQLLNLLYDITSPHLVSMVITEKGMLPCTSVPVVLRVRHNP